MNPALRYYDQILARTVIPAIEFQGGTDYTHFRAPKHIHSFTVAFGLPEIKFGCFCDTDVEAVFRIKAAGKTEHGIARYYFKLNACWQDWEKREHPAEIILNGKTLYNDFLFLENVCKGWPSLYLKIPPDFLKNSDNRVVIKNLSEGKNTLVIHRAEILRYPDKIHMTVRSCPEFVKEGDNFNVFLSLVHEERNIQAVFPSKFISFEGRNGEQFRFKALKSAKKVKIAFESGGEKCEGMVSQILSRSDDKLFVGMDCDDYRHDNTTEIEELLEIFNETQIGNFVLFRPNPGRNYPPAHPATRQKWKKIINYCVKNDISFQVARALPTLDGKAIQQLGRRHFHGFQKHELYLVFQPLSKCAKEFSSWKTMSQAKKKYIHYMEKTISDARVSPATKIYAGIPDLFSTVYLRETSVDLILCEPVSNASLLLGAARGTGKKFGAHIPLDWYFGFPHDKNALARFKIMLYLAYAYGGETIYSESSLFKTNSYSRNDRESAFCRKAREILRDFYKFTAFNPRPGAPEAPFALMFGNLENIFWLPDDRLPELADLNDWDRLVWGKKLDSAYRLIWKASEAWLPQLPIEKQEAHESLTRMFTGSPYGQVDLVSPFSERLQRYKAAAFLGWNTMNEKIYGNLKKFVKDGGILFICGCHFDTRDVMAGQPAMLRGGRINELAGLEISGAGKEILNGLRNCRLGNITAEKFGEHFYLNRYGRGKVYFGNFHDYPHDRRLVREIQLLLEKIAKETAASSEVKFCSKTPAVFNFNIREKHKIINIIVSNIAWYEPDAKSEFEIYCKGRQFHGTLKGGESASFNFV